MDCQTRTKYLTGGASEAIAIYVASIHQTQSIILLAVGKLHLVATRGRQEMSLDSGVQRCSASSARDRCLASGTWCIKGWRFDDRAATGKGPVGPAADRSGAEGDADGACSYAPRCGPAPVQRRTRCCALGYAQVDWGLFERLARMTELQRVK